MSAPIIWIFLPAVLAGVLFILRSKKIIVTISGIVMAGILSISAILVPIGEPVSIGSFIFQFTIDTSFSILGRSFIINPNLAPILFLIYAGLTYWLIGTLVSEYDSLFIPSGLLISALSVAAITVEPFLYAALIIELIALVAVILLSPPGTKKIRGSMRFLSIQTIGMGFILVGGWVLTGVETTPVDIGFLLQVAAILGLGFGLLLAIFPFHSWIPVVSEEANPFSAAFVFYVIPQVVLLFLLNFLSRLDWLGSDDAVYLALRIMGIIMVTFGGIWASFQTHLSRIFGFLVIMEIGFSVLSMSLLNPTGLLADTNIPDAVHLNSQGILIFFSQFFPRLLAFGLLSLGMLIIKRNYGDLRLENISGCFYSFPYATASIIIAVLSLIGLPFLAGFPTHLALLTEMIRQSALIAMLMMLGSFGLLVALTRTIYYQVLGGKRKTILITESNFQKVLFILGCSLLVLGGIFPNVFIMINLKLPPVF